MADFHDNLIEDSPGIHEIVRTAHRIAVLGIKTEQQADQPSFRIPQYLMDAGFEIIPVPVYYPEATEILGKPVFREVSDVPGDIDILDVFRRPTDIPQHVDDILAKKPRVVWFQSGIRNEEAAEAFARAGIKVVQDHCLMVEHRRSAAAA
jgi:predicted CoA-binding protein